MLDDKKVFRSGFVALLGRPNVGKSSLVNRLLREKVSIVSPVPQTTRHSLRCILTTERSQIVFVDTPGFHEPHHALGEYMMQRARDAVEDADCVCLILDAGRPEGGAEEELLRKVLQGISTPRILVVNKIDLLSEPKDLDRIVSAWSSLSPEVVVTVSATRGDNLDALLEAIEALLPEAPPLYPEDMLMDQSERFLASECIREKAFLALRDEIPHGITVVVEEYKTPEEYPDRTTAYIRAILYVERENHKGIVIGESGKKLKHIGLLARKELEKRLGFPVYLDLWVKVRPKWRRSPQDLRRFGYES
ncbi:GTPase Era [Aminiphilus sp.]|uniref:GTPase Era n=1 Tax=Aminiphilus sp. TaxID=1872488 RepID=UPI00262ED2DC|nr:GTPase Era [Aminiphilus sp.]